MSHGIRGRVSLVALAPAFPTGTAAPGRRARWLHLGTAALALLWLVAACGDSTVRPDADGGEDVDGLETTDGAETSTCVGGCPDHASCTETDTGWSCSCDEGWAGDGSACTDIDECTAGTHDCGTHATCRNTPGGFECPCEPGYVVGGDGACVEADVCTGGLHDCAVNATCVVEPDGYRCECGSDVAANCRDTLRGVAVVVDFADSRLEDYVSSDPEAFTSLDRIRTQLDAMSAHWDWLSVGTRHLTWEIVRTELPDNLTPDAFSDWVAFREAAVESVRATTDLTPYDADGDGVVDAMFLIASSGELEYEYLMGGMGQVAGARTFVDGQGSLSVRMGATGNFNHETGHCLGLPDIYGDHDTVQYLSLMSDSWPLPPIGFSAYDRWLLGWLDPVVVEADTADLELRPAEEYLEAVLIPAGGPTEAFLVEYRRRPIAGYGSTTGPRYDGLAIYHLLGARRDAGNNTMLPPLLALEPADGSNSATEPPEQDDFWFPGNASMTGPFVGRSRYSGEPVVRIEGFERTAEGIRFDVVLLADGPIELPNLLPNGDFEAGAGDAPDGWTFDAWDRSTAVGTWDAAGGRGGSRCVRIDLGGENDAHWSRTVAGLVAGRNYVLHGWVRGEAIAGESAFLGANLSLMGTWDHSADRNLGSFDWRELALVFTAAATAPGLGCRLGHMGSTVTGTAWFDDLSLVELAP